MNKKIELAVTQAFSNGAVRVYCPATPRMMFGDVSFLHLSQIANGDSEHPLEVVLVYSDYTYQLAQNLNRAQTPTLFVFTADYPAPREITTAALMLDLKALFTEKELDELFGYYEC